MKTKQDLRASVRAQKKVLTEAEIARRSEELCRMVLHTDVYRQAKSVYGYLPFNQEVNLYPLLLQAISDGKLVALPKCYGKDMRFVVTSDLARIEPSTFGAPQPIDDEPFASDKTALVIVPGLVFDHRGYRIGYGGGYYDRFLSAEPGHPTISLCFDFQLVPQLDNEPHDIPVDTVFSR